MPHTPGPWKVGADGGWAPWSDSIEVTTDSEPVCFTAGINAETQKANARLIAAAPDLLAVAKMALAIATMELGEADAPSFGPSDMKIAAFAAISKAEGR